MFILRMVYQDPSGQYSEDTCFFGPYSTEEDANVASVDKLAEADYEHLDNTNWVCEVFQLNATHVSLHLAI